MPTVRSVINGASLGGMSMFIPPANMSTFNTGLNPFTQYNCYVTANTSVGEGIPSQIVIGKTDQSSMELFRLTANDHNLIMQFVGIGGIN